MDAHSRRELLRWTGFAGAVVLAGCPSRSNPGNDTPTTRPTGTTSFDPLSNPDNVATAETAELFDCKYTPGNDSETGSGLNFPRFTAVGPFAFCYGLELSSPVTTDESTEYARYKCPMAVKRIRTVTVVIPEGERSTGVLLVGSAWIDPANNPTVEDGYRSVRFEPCGSESTPSPSHWTVWGGGFLIAGRRSLTVEIWTDDDVEPRTAVLSFEGNRTKN